MIQVPVVCRAVRAIDIDVFLAETPYQQELMRGARYGAEGWEGWFVTAEDLILLKLLAGRAKDQIDVSDVLFVQGSLDAAYMRHGRRRSEFATPWTAPGATIASRQQRLPPHSPRQVSAEMLSVSTCGSGLSISSRWLRSLSMARRNWKGTTRATIATTLTKTSTPTDSNCEMARKIKRQHGDHRAPA